MEFKMFFHVSETSFVVPEVHIRYSVYRPSDIRLV